jgi:uncharacterized membrane protein
VLDFHAWTFFFAIAFVVGLFSLHRLSFVHETAGNANPLLMRDVLLEARRSLRGLSSVAGLLRVARVPPWLAHSRASQAGGNDVPATKIVRYSGKSSAG